MANMFAEVDTIEEVIFQAIGAGSVCWEDVEEAGTFHSEQALRVGEQALERVRELIVGRG